MTEAAVPVPKRLTPRQISVTARIPVAQSASPRVTWRKRVRSGPGNADLKFFILFAIWALLLSIGWVLGTYVNDLRSEFLQTISPQTATRMLTAAALLYVAAAALPFVPGAEIGIALLVAFGASVAPLVYLCMLAALYAAFLAGRLVPARLLVRAFSAIGLHHAAGLVEVTASQPPEDRKRFLAANLPPGLAGRLLGHRRIALAILLNMPGNTLIGGGGGIALIAGMSRLVSHAGFLLTIAIAVAPVPLIVWLTGYGT